MDQLDLILRIIFIYSYLVIQFFSGLGLNNQDEGILQANCSRFDPGDTQGIRKCKEQNSGLPYAVQGTKFLDIIPNIFRTIQINNRSNSSFFLMFHFSLLDTVSVSLS